MKGKITQICYTVGLKLKEESLLSFHVRLELKFPEGTDASVGSFISLSSGNFILYPHTHGERKTVPRFNIKANIPTVLLSVSGSILPL